MNTYNCTSPGYLFTGYERLLEDLENGFCNGHSFALIGGRRCGKTSLLLELQSRLKQTDSVSLRLLPRYLDIQSLDQVTKATLFERLYALTIEGTKAPPFACGNLPYEGFLNALEKARPDIEQVYGADWVIILLIDELDAVLGSLPDDQFFQNLRNLLMNSAFSRHFRLVASGAKHLSPLISSGSSPLNNLRQKYLAILTHGAARELVSAGFDPDLCADVESLLLPATGRHPYLMQGLLEKLWLAKAPLDKQLFKRCTRDFLREHSGDFERWLEMFGTAEHAVYRLLCDAQDHKMHIREIRRRLPAELRPDCNNALCVLSYHGVIEDSDPDEPEIAGALFRDWYLDRLPTVVDPPSGTATDLTPKNSPRPTPVSTPSIHVQVNNINTNNNSINHLANAAEIKRVIQQLKKEIEALPIEQVNRDRALYAIEKGEFEIKNPDSNEAVKKDSVKNAFEKTTQLLKKANAPLDAMDKFIKTAEKVAPYLGQTAGWLSTLLG